MTIFEVRYLKLGDSAVTSEQLPSISEATLRQQLVSRGLTVLSVRDTALQQKSAHRWQRRQSKPASYALFCREIRTLVQAGMTVVEAVDTLCARENATGADPSLAHQVLQALQLGQSLSQALASLPAVPSVLVAAVRSGERTSNLVEALDDYLRFDGLVSSLRKKLVSAAIYPALVCTVGLVISLFLLLVVMPNFASMYENLRVHAVEAASWTITLSLVIAKHKHAVWAVLIITALAIAWWVQSGTARTQLLRWVLSVDWMRRRVEDFELAMVYQALSLLLKGGYPMTEALKVAGSASLSPRLALALQASRQQIEAGGAVSLALANQQLCDEVGRRLMAAAERNGDFHLATQVVSRLHGERFELFVERLTRLIEPLLLLFVAVVVGGIVVMMYFPVFDMATQLH